MELARTVIFVVEVYAAIGLAVALPFAAVGIGRVAEGARGSSVAFRLLIVPGAVVLWPIVLLRWVATYRASGTAAEGTPG